MNLEDMLFAALVDGTLTAAEREEVEGFVDKIQLTEELAQTILTETKMKLDNQMVVSECESCGATLPPGTRTCPACNAAIA